MKKLYLFICFITLFAAKAQNVNFQTAQQFKNEMVTSNQIAGIAYNSAGQHMKVDTNNDMQIQVSEALLVYEIRLDGNEYIAGVQGIEYFTNVRVFETDMYGAILTLNLTALINLEEVKIRMESINSIQLNGLASLKSIDIQQTNIHTLSLTGLSSIEDINLDHNYLNQAMDVSGLPTLLKFYANYNAIPSVNFTGSVNLEEIKLLQNNLYNIDLTGLDNLTVFHVGTNHISTLDLSHTPNLKTLNCSTNLLTALDIPLLPDLEYLYCHNNNITALNVQGLEHIIEISCFDNELTSLNVAGLSTLFNLNARNNHLTTFEANNHPALKFLYVSDNDLTSLTVSGLPNLQYLICNNNQLTQIDLGAGFNSLAHFQCNDNLLTSLDLGNLTYSLQGQCKNNLLTTLSLKNGHSEYVVFSGNPLLTYICADESDINTVQYQLPSYGLTNVEINSYCTPDINPFNTLQGTVRFYPDASDVTGPGIVAGNVMIQENQTSLINTTNNLGNYTFAVTGLQSSVVYPILENPELFYVPTVDYEFTSLVGETITKDINFWPNDPSLMGLVDVETVLLPINNAMPGEDAIYTLIVRNKGTAAANGAVNLTYNDAVLSLVSSTPAASNNAGVLAWPLINLMPFETREIDFVMHANTPTDEPPVTLGSVLEYTATAVLATGDDYTPADNTFVFNQVVLNSFDPNDKTCLEGSLVTTQTVGNYVHYMIRFENNGTANAQRIIVRDVLDSSKFDSSSIIALSASHNYFTRRDDNLVEFIFDNIQLPFDDANNDGYIAFKVKIWDFLQEGDTFSNNAKIYFDYNLPITTNTYTSTIGNPPAPQADANQYFCSAATIANLTVAPAATNIKWYSEELYGELLSPDTPLVDGFTYYVSQTVYGFETERTPVTVTILDIQAPEAAPEQTLCGVSTVADLTVAEADNNNIIWYTTLTGGTAVPPATALIDGTTYFASQTVYSCESARTAVVVTLNNTLVPEAVPVQNFCNAAAVGNLTVTTTNANINWYTTLTGGSALSATTALFNGTTYYASQTINGCESARTAVMVTVTQAQAPQATASQSFCIAATVANLTVTTANANISWYNALTGGTALTATTALVNGATYYASKTINGCESTRTAVVVTITQVAAPQAAPTQTLCGGSTVANLTVTTANANISWYASVTEGTALTATTALVNGATYYASQTINGCESTRTAVVVTINQTIAPEAASTQTFCTSATVANLTVTTANANISWYNALTGGTALTATTALVNGATYYASQTINGCESTRTAVVVTITQVAAPQGESVQTVEIGSVISDIEIEAEGTIQWYLTQEDAQNQENNLDPNYVIETGTHTFYVTQTLNSCTSQPFAITVTTVLGTKDFDNKGLMVYPNPVDAFLNVSSNNKIDTIIIYNQLGQVVLSKTINLNETQVNMAQLAAGTYIVKISDGASYKIVKVVKQ